MRTAIRFGADWHVDRSMVVASGYSDLTAPEFTNPEALRIVSVNLAEPLTAQFSCRHLVVDNQSPYRQF